MGVAIFVLVTGAIKLADAAATSVHVFRASRRKASSDDLGIDWGWTPVFAWSRRQRKRLEGEDKSTILYRALISVMFRAPVLALVQAGLVLWAVGAIDGHLSRSRSSCAFPTVASGPSGWLNVAAGAVSILVAMTALVSLLHLIAQGRSENLARDAGHVIGRSRPDQDGEKTLGPVEVALSTTVALFVSFAALYAALLAVDGSALTAFPCHLNWIDMIYFSASVGATVGFGDISPSTSALRFVTTLEIIVFFTVLALFLQALWVRPGRESP